MPFSRLKTIATICTTQNDSAELKHLHYFTWICQLKIQDVIKGIQKHQKLCFARSAARRFWGCGSCRQLAFSAGFAPTEWYVGPAVTIVGFGPFGFFHIFLATVVVVRVCRHASMSELKRQMLSVFGWVQCIFWSMHTELYYTDYSETNKD